MSIVNQTTHFITLNKNTGLYQDLSGIFQPLQLGSSAPAPTYFCVNGNDLYTIFAGIGSNSGIGYDTGYVINNYNNSGNEKDLSQIFAPYTGLTQFTSTSGQLTTTSYLPLTLASNFIMPAGYNYFNFYIIGGGGSGFQVTQPGGGGGSGGYLQAINIPYTNSGANIKSITYFISAGSLSNDDTTVTINYNNGTNIFLSAGNGQSANENSGTTGASGGINTYSTTTSFYNLSNVTSVNGAQGKTYGSPTSIFENFANGYTAAGASGDENGVNGIINFADFRVTAQDGTTYSNYSVGGSAFNVVQGYGSGGAATTANYNQNAPAYRYGSQGTVIYTLSS
jgi:hypothetical protein